MHFDPGKPWPNGANESFNGKFRDECLSTACSVWDRNFLLGVAWWSGQAK
ncbi:MAG: integrase core domain-containing protein [Pseudomonadales bacterium]|nr:integrase core domain-containing protein [Pseudomonadales bacterium]